MNLESLYWGEQFHADGASRTGFIATVLKHMGHTVVPEILDQYNQIFFSRL